MNNKMKVSIIFNLAIVTATLVGMVLAIFDTARMGVPFTDVFKYYTTLSNIFLFISAILMTCFNFRALYRKDKPTPNAVYIVKICATTVTTITMLTVFCFLTPVAIYLKPEDYTVELLYTGSNCVFHVINPILGLITLLFFESNHKIDLPHVTFTLVFTMLYEVYYTLGLYQHPDEIEKYDWYHFTIFGLQYVIPILVFFLAITFLIGWLLWLGNRKIHVLEGKKQVTTK